MTIFCAQKRLKETQLLEEKLKFVHDLTPVPPYLLFLFLKQTCLLLEPPLEKVGGKKHGESVPMCLICL